MAAICFYHSADLDGLCSGHIVESNVPCCRTYAINYDDPFPWDMIDKDTDVYMVDFSLQPFTDMLRLINEAKSLTWIDHHKTAIHNLTPAEPGVLVTSEIPNFNVYCRIGIGACELCWEYFHPDKPVPYGVHLLAAYDVWDHTDPATLPFQYYARIHMHHAPGDAQLDFMISDTLNPAHLTTGNGIMLYEAQLNAKIVRSYAYDTELAGLRVLAWNRHPSNSLNFASLWDPKKYDAMCAYGYCRDKWVVSLYTDKSDVDVSAVAKSFGGGGHAGAAGFHTETLPEGLKG